MLKLALVMLFTQSNQLYVLILKLQAGWVVSLDGPPPLKTLDTLARLARKGMSMHAVVDAAVSAKILQSVRASSANTYASHWAGISKFASLFEFDILCPSAEDIRRVLVCLNCSSTQRGWLAAWN